MFYFFRALKKQQSPAIPRRDTNTYELHRQEYFHAYVHHLILAGQEQGVCMDDGNPQIINSKLVWLKGFTLYPQGGFGPDLYLGGKIGCSFFFLRSPSQRVAMRLPSRSLCSISIGGHLFFITIWRSFPRHFSYSST